MDIEFIKSLVDLMKENELTELSLEEEGLRIRLSKKNGQSKQEVIAVPQMAPMVAQMAQPVPGVVPAAPPAQKTDDERCEKITAPMVGTFYRAASPDADPYVATGDMIDPEAIVCIIEAMKVMNEIKAETTGKVVDIFVENGEAVEYGQPLFLVEPEEPI